MPTTDAGAPGAAEGGGVRSPDEPGPPGVSLLRCALRRASASGVVVLLATLGSSGCALALPAVLGRALDQVLAGRDAASWTAGCAVLVGAAAVADAVDGLASGSANARTTAWLRSRLFRHVLGAGPRTTERIPEGDLVARLVGNAATAGTAPAAVAATAAAVVTPVGGLVVLVLIDPWTALVFVAGMPLLALLLRVFVRATGDSAARYQQAQGEIAGRLAEAVAGARTVTAAGTEEREAARILGPLPELARQGLRMWHVRARATAQATTLLPLVQLTVLAAGGLRLAAGALSVGGLLACWRYAALATGIGTLAGQLSGLVRSRAAGRRLAEVQDASPEVVYGEQELPACAGGAALELRSVTVRRGGRVVLRDVDLAVPAGATVAVVGGPGSGKSALAAVVGRLVEPAGGSVRLGGAPVSALAHDALRGAVAYAFERPALLGATVHGTIALGSSVDRAAVVAGARAACADGFIRRAPRGYGTPVAELPLSGGECQRLGLARAFARPGTRLLVLDDALSSLDAETRERVARALHAGGGVTRLVTARSADTAASADLVVWLANGRVRRVGTHAELWEDAGYREVLGGR